MSVEWTQDGDGRYLVESKEHLLQIMNKGVLGTDTGSVPTDYWSASYLQTQDIDLVNDHASIVPIGNDTSAFQGQYDGGLFQISNCACAATGSKSGLFGYANNAVLKRIRLTGVWTLSPSTSFSYAGFLVGRFNYGQMFNIECGFLSGTAISGVTNSYSFGAVVGEVRDSTLQSIKLLGSVTFEAVLKGTNGGLFGTTNDSTFTDCHNFASFPTGISGNTVGGIFGSSTTTTNTKCVNGMVGNLTCSSSCGGIAGSIIDNSHWENIVNSMTGNVLCDPSFYGRAGGVFGYVGCSSGNLHSATRVLNYMYGDITSGSTPGGMIGELQGSDPATLDVSKSVVAMRGSVNQSVRGSEAFVPGQLEVTVDTSFGMTNTSNDYGLATMVVDTALVYHANFSDLPYVDLSSTDPDGTVHKTAFLYANIGGKYPQYTHLSVHASDVKTPIYIDFGLGSDNDTAYATYANVDTNSVYVHASLTIVATTADFGYDVIRGDVVYEIPTYDKNDYLFSGANVYDITEAGAEVAAAANDLFDTGDRVAINVNASPMTTTFVNRGDEINLTGANALLLPFDPAVTDPQDATITLSDATSVAIDFDNTSGNIVVDGTTYSHGDYFVMDGQKVTVVDV